MRNFSEKKIIPRMISTKLVLFSLQLFVLLHQLNAFFVSRGTQSDTITDGQQFCGGQLICSCHDNTFIGFNGEAICRSNITGCNLMVENSASLIYTAADDGKAYRLTLVNYGTEGQPVCTTIPQIDTVFLLDYQNQMLFYSFHANDLKRRMTVSLDNQNKLILEISTHMTGLVTKVFINCDNNIHCFIIKFTGTQEYPLLEGTVQTAMGQPFDSMSTSLVTSTTVLATSSNSLATSTISAATSTISVATSTISVSTSTLSVETSTISVAISTISVATSTANILSSTTITGTITDLSTTNMPTPTLSQATISSTLVKATPTITTSLASSASLATPTLTGQATLISKKPTDTATLTPTLSSDAQQQSTENIAATQNPTHSTDSLAASKPTNTAQPTNTAKARNSSAKIAPTTTTSGQQPSKTIPTTTKPVVTPQQLSTGEEYLLEIVLACAGFFLLLVFILICCLACKRRRKRHQFKLSKNAGEEAKPKAVEVVLPANNSRLQGTTATSPHRRHASLRKMEGNSLSSTPSELLRNHQLISNPLFSTAESQEGDSVSVHEMEDIPRDNDIPEYDQRSIYFNAGNGNSTYVGDSRTNPTIQDILATYDNPSFKSDPVYPNSRRVSIIDVERPLTPVEEGSDSNDGDDVIQFPALHPSPGQTSTTNLLNVGKNKSHNDVRSYDNDEFFFDEEDDVTSPAYARINRLPREQGI